MKLKHIFYLMLLGQILSPLPCFAQAKSDPESLILAEKWGEAIRVLETESATPRNDVLSGYAALQLGDTTSALQRFLHIEGTQIQSLLPWSKALVVAHPDRAIAHLLHADALARNGRLQEARAELDEAIYRDPHSAVLFNVRGTVQAQLRDQSNAIRDFNQALKLNPRFVDAHVNLAISLMTLEQYPIARKHLDQALALNPTNAIALNARGVWHSQVGSWEGSKVDLDRAIQIEPALKSILTFNRAFMERGQVAESLLRNLPLVAPISSSVRLFPVDMGTGRTVNVWEVRSTPLTSTSEGMRQVYTWIRDRELELRGVTTAWEPSVLIAQGGTGNSASLAKHAFAEVAFDAGKDYVITHEAPEFARDGDLDKKAVGDVTERIKRGLSVAKTVFGSTPAVLLDAQVTRYLAGTGRDNSTLRTKDSMTMPLSLHAEAAASLGSFSVLQDKVKEFVHDQARDALLERMKFGDGFLQLGARASLERLGALVELRNKLAYKVWDRASALQATNTWIHTARDVEANLAHEVATIPSVAEGRLEQSRRLTELKANLQKATTYQGIIERELSMARGDLFRAQTSVTTAQLTRSFFKQIAPTWNALTEFTTRWGIPSVVSDVHELLEFTGEHNDQQAETDFRKTTLLLDFTQSLGSGAGILSSGTGWVFTGALLERELVHKAEIAWNAMQRQNETQQLAFGGILAEVPSIELRRVEYHYDKNDLSGSFRDEGVRNRFAVEGSWRATYGSREDHFTESSRYSFEGARTYSGRLITGSGTVTREHTELYDRIHHEPLLEWMNAFETRNFTEKTIRHESYHETFNGAEVNQHIQELFAPQKQPTVSLKQQTYPLVPTMPSRDDRSAPANNQDLGAWRKWRYSNFSPPIEPPRPSPAVSGFGIPRIGGYMPTPQPKVGGVIMPVTIVENAQPDWKSALGITDTSKGADGILIKNVKGEVLNISNTSRHNTGHSTWIVPILIFPATPVLSANGGIQ